MHTKPHETMQRPFRGKDEFYDTALSISRLFVPLFSGENRAKGQDFIQALKALSIDRDHTAKPKIREILRGEANLISKLNSVLPYDCQIPVDEDSIPVTVGRLNERGNSPPASDHSASASPTVGDLDSDEIEGDEANLEKALIFCEKVRSFFGNHDDHLLFLRLLHLYSIKAVEKTQLRKLVAQLLENNSKLVHEFDKVFYHYLNTSEQFACLDQNKKSNAGDSTAEQLGDSVGENKKSNSGDLSAKKKIEKKKKMQRCGSIKSIQDLDFTNCESCTPSYRLLPQDYPIPYSSNRTKLESEVLDDHWVCRPPMLKDYSLSHKQINKYEEVIQECEDGRYEFDMLFEYCQSVFNSVKKLLENICQGEITLQLPINNLDYFTIHNLRFIEQIYGEDGCEVLELLSQQPHIVLPVILRRLQQKKDDLKTLYDGGANELWKKVYANYYHKSLGNNNGSK